MKYHFMYHFRFGHGACGHFHRSRNAAEKCGESAKRKNPDLRMPKNDPRCDAGHVEAVTK